MNINDTVFGFTLLSKKEVGEISGSLKIFKHKKSGAKLCFIDREDRNLSFAISFSTPPSDDSGIFHIIEHSVLCGSKKFPVKEPFVELLKGSLNTFLNAMTYEDKTVYPVASRCKKDFYNLVDVYLDAVFNPLMLTDKRIFEQEGWHLEFNEDGALCYNGVVFNEMSGAYSSPDELSGAEISRLLFSGSIYEYDSGGAPNAIPGLSFEDFKKAHETYYKPENALLVLDGSVNLNEILPLIDSYLSAYEESGFKVEFRTPTAKISQQKRCFYEATEEDDGKARLVFSSVFGGAYHQKKSLASAILIDALCGSNEAPLKKKLLESCICEDVSVFINKGLVNTLTLELHGVEPERIKEAERLISEILESIIREGIKKELLQATISRMKFRLREKDLGSYPRGIANILSVLDLWQYGIDPAEAFKSEELISELEADINSRFYEACLEEMTLSSLHKASLVMIPTSEESEFSKKLTASLSSLKSRLNHEELEKIKKNCKDLKQRQESPDTPEALNSIPKLEIEDISLGKRGIKSEILHSENSTVLLNKLDISGILYTELYFSAENFTNEELTLLSLLASLLTNLDTKTRSALEIKNDIKTYLGSFSPNAIAYTDLKENGRAIPLFSLHISALSENADKIPELISEVLLNTNLNAPERIKKILTQIRSATEDTVLSCGDGVAGERLEAILTESGMANEEILGITAYQRLKTYEKDFDGRAEEIICALKEIAKKLFVQNRLTLGVGGDGAEEICERIISLFPIGEKPEKTAYIPKKSVKKEGVALPIRTGHSAMGICLEKARELLGGFKIARSILSYGYLWNSVRVMGGAYGTGLSVRRCGNIIFSSYRDPSPLSSIEIFKNSANALREFINSGEELTKYVIGAIGEYDLLLSPRTINTQAMADYITGWSSKDEEKLICDMINCNREKLSEVASVLDGMSNGSFCVVGNKEMLEKSKEINIVIP